MNREYELLATANRSRDHRHLSRLIAIAVALLSIALFSMPPRPVLGQSGGRVVAVADGDTITVLDPSNRQIRVRLAGIDAPEKSQDFGNKAKQYLSGLVYDKHVTLEGSKLDRYDRLVAKVMLGKVDINVTMIHAGLAWHYKQYEKEQTPTDRLIYSSAEKAARNLKTGIWSTPGPVAPWEFRAAAK
jgi:endonuclease YncB( thermonuclease family)